jgi:hypothetical protein
MKKLISLFLVTLTVLIGIYLKKTKNQVSETILIEDSVDTILSSPLKNPQ